MDSLRAIVSEQGVSREAVVRELLAEYTDAQAGRGDEYRLTHISTLLRYPPPPIWGSDDDGRVRLAFRAPDALIRAAEVHALRLPGQPPKRGPRDYSARPLTDALTTAIACRRPFVDDGLEGLPALLSHRVAEGLWRLTRAATLTRAERQLLLSQDRGSNAAIVLREENVAWHSGWRFQIALHLARQLLGSEGGRLAMLESQTDEFDLLLYDLELDDDFEHDLLRDAPRPSHSMEGRGGAAVWRAHRAVAMSDLTRALFTWSGGGQAFRKQLEPPGWHLVAPPDWHGVGYRYGQPRTSEHASHLAEHKVIEVVSGSRSVLWPYDQTGQPIDGFEIVIRAAPTTGADRLVELVLVGADQLDWPPHLRAERAFELGLISHEELSHLLSSATNQRHNIIAAARQSRLQSPDDVAMLTAVVDDPDAFTKVARRLRLRGAWGAVPQWAWRTESIARSLADGVDPRLLPALVEAMSDAQNYHLEGEMRSAALKAFWLGRSFDDR